MNITPINSTNSTQKGKKIGTAAGFGIGTAFAIKNAKDTFIKATAQAANKVGGKAAGYAIASGVCALAIGATTLAGRAIGSLVDKITQKSSEKTLKKVIAQTVEYGVKNSDTPIKTHSIDELDSL